MDECSICHQPRGTNRPVVLTQETKENVSEWTPEHGYRRSSWSESGFVHLDHLTNQPPRIDYDPQGSHGPSR